MTRRSLHAVCVFLWLLVLTGTSHGQAAPQTDLKAMLRERFDVVALQQGLALVPRQATDGVRMVQIVGGVVSVDGVVVTGQQLRDRLGADADMVLQVSYLDPVRQRELAGASPADPGTTAPERQSGNANVTERAQVTRGDVVRFGGDVTVGAGERVQGNVVSIGGSVVVEGEVTGDVVAIGGPVTLGPQAVVQGDLSVIGGSLTRSTGARVLGDTHEVGRGRDTPDSGRDRARSSAFGSFWPRLGSLTATIVRVSLLVLFGLVGFAIARKPIERIGARAASAPVRSGLIGLLAEILLLPVVILLVVVLAVSIVGIPLLALVPFAILLVMLVMFVGFIALAGEVGRWLVARFGWTARGDYAAIVLGILSITGLTLVAKLAAIGGGAALGWPLGAIGYSVEYLAWTIGFGAALLSFSEARRWSRPAGPATSVEPGAAPSAV